MFDLKALCLAGVAGLAAFAAQTISVEAADLLPAPPPVYVPPPAPLGGGWYLRGDVAAGILTQRNESSTFGQGQECGGAPCGFNIDDSSITQQAVVGAGVGYQFNAFFRADVTGEYRFGGHYKRLESYVDYYSNNCNPYYTPGAASYRCADRYSGSISNAVFLANGYVDLGTWYAVTPYVGAGVGVAYNTISSLTDTSVTNPGGGGYAASQGSAHFAYALMAGISYALTPNLKLDVGYRYLDMGRLTSGAIGAGGCNGGVNQCQGEIQSFKLASSDIRIGLRYQFADLLPYAPPPVIARY